MKESTAVITLISSLVFLGLGIMLAYNLIRDQLRWRRYEKAAGLIVKVGDLAIDKRLKAKEARHLINTLSDPTPAALQFVRDRVEELSN